MVSYCFRGASCILRHVTNTNMHAFGGRSKVAEVSFAASQGINGSPVYIYIYKSIECMFFLQYSSIIDNVYQHEVNIIFF